MTTDLLEQAESEVEEILGHPPPVPFDVHPATDKQRIISEAENQLARLRELYSAFHDRALQGRAVQRSLHEAVFGEMFDAAESISIACVVDILDVVCPE